MHVLCNMYVYVRTYVLCMYGVLCMYAYTRARARARVCVCVIIGAWFLFSVNEKYLYFVFTDVRNLFRNNTFVN